MASNAASFLPSVLPTCAQVALAITIIQSRPPHMAIHEYVLQLRQNLRQGVPAHTEEAQSHYIDLVAHWQEQCMKTQEDNERLRSVNIKLERSLQQLTHRTTSALDDGRPSTASGSFATRQKTVVSTNRRKPPAAKLAEQSAAETQEGLESDYDFLEGLGEDGARLQESLYTVHQLCRSSGAEARAICHSLVNTASALAKVIRLIAHNYEHLSTRNRMRSAPLSFAEDKSDFALAMTVSARAFMAVLVGITRMTDISDDQGLPGLVICGLAEVFKTTLLAIEASARQTADTVVSAPVQLKKTKSKATPKAIKESVPARSLAHFLIGLLGLLEKSNATHQKLFEAFMFHLLERVGKRLYYCTFGQHRSFTVEGNLLPPIEPKDASDVIRQEKDVLAMRLEVKALILILKRAMGLSPHHMSSPTGKANTTQSALRRTLSLKTLPAAPRTRLSVLAKDRLQRTLVACMYGSKTDDEFLDVLTKPVPSMRVSSLPDLAKIDDEDVERWYKEEVWKLVGWDILAREKGLGAH